MKGDLPVILALECNCILWDSQNVGVMEIDAISEVISLKITTLTVNLLPAFIIFLTRISGRQHLVIQSPRIPPDYDISHRTLQIMTSSQTFYLLIYMGISLVC